jgi:hypothetical protein
MPPRRDRPQGPRDRFEPPPSVLEPPRISGDAEGIPPAYEIESGPGQSWDEAFPASQAPRQGSDRRGNHCRLTLTDRQTIHAEWEVRPDTFERVQHELGEGWNGHRTILRIHGTPALANPAAPPPGFFDQELEEGATERSMTVEIPERAWRVDMGVVTPAGLFYPLVSSNTVVTPGEGAEPSLGAAPQPE